VLVALVLLEACASQEIRPLRPFEIATAPYRSDKPESVLGTLMYEGGCLLFRPDEGPGPLLPVWPTGTRFEEALVTFHEPGRAEQRIAIGEEVRLDGQSADWPSLDRERFAPFEHQCGAEPFFVADVTPAN
jgi:hypothetical protein